MNLRIIARIDVPEPRPVPARALWISTVLFYATVLVSLNLLPSAAFAAADSSVKDAADDILVTELENGLRVVLLEDRRTPVVAFQLWVDAGSSDESFYTGIAHLFEHMMFKGSKNIEPEVHARLINERGGRINAYTNRDVTVYHEDVTSESLPLVIDLEAERFANLSITHDTLQSEREVVLEERRLRTEDTPDGRAFEALAATVWQAHPYRWPVIGWRSGVESVTVEACQEFFDTYYAANNLTVVIVGDFETEPTLERIRRSFGRLKSTPMLPRNPTTVVPQRGERRTTVFFEAKIPLLYAGWHAPPSGHPDGEALDITSEILSGGRSSRLYRSLVYEKEKALYAHGGFIEMREAGMFYAVAGARPGTSVEELEAVFMAEIDRIAENGVTESELAKAKRQMEVGLVNGFATNHSQASRIGYEIVAFGRVRSLDERLAAIRDVSLEDVQRVVRTYLKPESRSVVHVVSPPPEEDSEEEVNP
jgi:zinc protease